MGSGQGSELGGADRQATGVWIPAFAGMTVQGAGMTVQGAVMTVQGAVMTGCLAENHLNWRVSLRTPPP